MTPDQQRAVDVLALDIGAAVKVRRVVEPQALTMVVVVYEDATPGIYAGTSRPGRDALMRVLLERVKAKTLTVLSVEDDQRRFLVRLRNGLDVLIVPHVPLAKGGE